ncbi:MAG: alpha/beta fold hydrolase, partial [Myxococcota bacterium]|nr:alpha/beta fold hydrolase [Myxococcota bacterium]
SIMPRAFERSVILPLPEAASGAADQVLEALYVPSPEPAESALIAPPHPQMGGSMESPVLTDMAWACQEVGVASLRFNWRGVGASSGRPSGEASDADLDFQAGLEFLAETVPGPRAACGYSFGAATALRAALRTPGIERLVLAAPPTALLPERALAEFRGPIFVVVGDRDEWVDLDRLSSQLAEAPAAHLEVIEDCDHVFMSALGRLGRSLADWWGKS